MGKDGEGEGEGGKVGGTFVTMPWLLWLRHWCTSCNLLWAEPHTPLTPDAYPFPPYQECTSQSSLTPSIFPGPPGLHLSNLHGGPISGFRECQSSLSPPYSPPGLHLSYLHGGTALC